MAVKIKLTRLGKIRNPQYRIVVADSRTRRNGRVTYTVTAEGYGTVFEGDATELPVERIDMFDSLKAAIAAAHPDED